MTSNTFYLFLLGFFLGFISMGAITKFGVMPDVMKGVEAKEQCELTLPRNQRCVRQYIPETIK
jgi:hypothetical protein